MSKEIDERVVSMQFDNAKFEKNVATSMSTLDKLKEKLKFNGAEKGLEKINDATKNNNVSVLASAVETVSNKFSALEVVGITALSNITNKAINAGEKIVKSLSIDQITSGWSKYEQKTANVQTLVNSTGKSVEEINVYLDKLMRYSDETSYGFTDMTSALATMTSSGGDINKLIPLIEGVANATAFAGKGASEFSRLMQYGVNQAYSMGYMQVQDWKSIEGATVNSKQLQEALIAAGESVGTIEKGVVTLNNFRSSLANNWLTSEVMEVGFGQFAKASDEILEGINSGKYESYKEGLDDIGYKYGEVAYRAAASAQEAKTFTEAIDATKDAVSSQWMKTFEIIFGTYDKAKELWTDLADLLWNIFASGGEKRNNILEKAFNSTPLSNIIEKLYAYSGAIDKVVKSAEDYNEIVNRVIRGEFGNTEKRWNKLTELGYNWKHVQNLVNEKLGNSYRREVDMNEVYGEQATLIEELTDEKLKELGLTDDEIRQYRELEEAAKAAGLSIEEYLKKNGPKTGRTLLLESIKNIGSAIKKIFDSIKGAWEEIFPTKSEDEIAVKLYNIIDAIHKLSEKLIISDESADKLKRTFKGLFAILDLIRIVIGGAFYIAFKVVKEVLKIFGTNVLDVTAAIGDLLVKFRDWLKRLSPISKIIQALAPYIRKVVSWVRKWIDAGIDWITTFKPITKLIELIAPPIRKAISAIKDWITETKPLEKIANKLKNFVTAIKNWFASLKDSDNLPRDIAKGIVDGLGYILKLVKNIIGEIIDYIRGGFEGNSKNIIIGLVNGIRSGIHLVWEVIVELAKALIEKFKEVLGIHSPSIVFMALGGFIIAGLVAGLTNSGGNVLGFFGDLWAKIKGFFEGLNLPSYFNKILSIAAIAVLFLLVKKLLNTMGVFAGFGDAIVTTLGNIGGAIRDVGKGIKNYLNAKALLNLAIAIGILAASVFLLTLADPDKLLGAVLVIGALAAILVGLIFVLSLLTKVSALSKSFKMSQLSIFLVSIGASLLLMALAMKSLSKLTKDQINQSTNLILGFIGIILALTLISQLAGKNLYNLGKTLKKMVVSMILLILVIKLISFISNDEIGRGFAVILGFVAIIGLLTLVSLMGGKNLYNLGKTLKQMAITMALMVLVIKLISFISDDELTRGLSVIGILSAIILAFVLIARIAGTTSMKGVAATLLAMALAIGILAAVVVLIGLVDEKNLEKGLIVVGLLSAMMSAILLASKGAAQSSKSILMVAAAVGVLAIALIAMTFIDTKKVLASAIAMTITMAAFALIMAASSKATTNITSILIITLAVAVLAGMLYLLGSLPIESTISAALSLSVLLVAVTAAVALLSGINPASAITGAIALTEMALPLLAFVGVLALASNVKSLETNAIILIKIVAIMTLLLIPLTLIGMSGPLVMVGIGALLLMAVPMLAFVGVLALMNLVPSAQKNAELIMSLMTTMSDILFKISLVAPLAVIAVAAITALSGVMLAFGVIATEIGALMTYIPKLQDFLNLGIPVMIQLAGGLGEMIGAFIGGIFEGIANSLPQIGTALTDFMTNVQGFVDGARSIDARVLEGIGILTGAILLITAADFIAGLMDVSPFMPSLSEFGTQLGRFYSKVTPFIRGAMKIKPKMLDGVKTLAEAIMLISGANIIDSIASLIGGGTSLSDFGEDLGVLGEGFAKFASKFEDLTGGQVIKAALAAKIIKVLAQAAQEVPNAGGLLAGLVGDNDIGDWAKKLPILGGGIAAFIMAIGTVKLNAATVEIAEKAADVIKVLAQAAKEIPNTGGWLADLVGDNDIGTWSAKLPKLGIGIAGFIMAIGTVKFNDAVLESSKKAAEAIKTLAQAAKEIPNTGGWLADLVGDNDIGTWSAKLPKLGIGIAGFIMAIGTVKLNAATVEIAEKAADVIKALALASKEIPNTGGAFSWLIGDNDIGDWGPKLGDLGTSVTKFVTNIQGVSKEAVKKAELATAIISVIANASGMDNFEDTIDTLVYTLPSLGDSLANFVTNIDAIAGEKLQTAGASIRSIVWSCKYMFSSLDVETMTSFGDGFKTLAEDGITKFVDKFSASTTSAAVSEALSKFAKTAGNAAKSQPNMDQFKTAGKQFAEGLINGMKSKQKEVRDAGFALGQKAVEGEKAGQQSESPSKLTTKAGIWLGEGLINGMKKIGSSVYDTGRTLGKDAVGSISKAMGSVNDILDSNISTQPTIRPVLDLTDVRSGVGSISSMLSMTPSIGVMTSLHSLNRSINNRQNGGNDDVVSAIRDLSDSMNNTSGNTYNLGGVTYNEGSDVAEAIQTIIRAARVERRR